MNPNEEIAPRPERPDSYVLSSPQWDIYQDQRMVGAVPTYNIGGYLDFYGPLDTARFAKAWQDVVDAHDSLRIRLID